MNLVCLSWNVRGLGRFEKVRAVGRTLRESRASFIFLQESKLQRISPRVRRSVMSSKKFEIEAAPSVGSAGGLIVLWDKELFMVESKVITYRAIFLVGQLTSIRKRCAFVNIYAPTIQTDRKVFFEYITATLNTIFVPIVMGGDFNAIVSAEEKSGIEFCHSASKVFADFIHLNGLIDLPMEGSRFTWFRGGAQAEASRLDRFLISTDILSWFPNLRQVALTRGLSDHKAVLLEDKAKRILRRPFKWFSHWVEHDDYKRLVNTTLLNGLDVRWEPF
ncbi:hypothetical protein HRI_004443800 [Hibiscus trionum]|uniref:Endonuclease/exonuclease/phosphatase domain-containing protein n=1 Tax=Hibiscus trionum TaxID=183268 RepID=A0A9W7J3A3_HIBTR|nr:hypothetical protein HRI_004443800 [Hibiscus trionum]